MEDDVDRLDDKEILKAFGNITNRVDALEADNQKLKEEISTLHNGNEIDEIHKENIGKLFKSRDKHYEYLVGLAEEGKQFRIDIDKLIEEGKQFRWDINANADGIKEVKQLINEKFDKQQTAQRLFENQVQERQDRMIIAMEDCIEFHNNQFDIFSKWMDAVGYSLSEVHEFHKTNMSIIHDKISNMEHYQEADPTGELNDIRTELVELPEIIKFKKSSKWDFLKALFRY